MFKVLSAKLVCIIKLRFIKGQLFFTNCSVGLPLGPQNVRSTKWSVRKTSPTWIVYSGTHYHDFNVLPYTLSYIFSQFTMVCELLSMGLLKGHWKFLQCLILNCNDFQKFFVKEFSDSTYSLQKIAQTLRLPSDQSLCQSDISSVQLKSNRTVSQGLLVCNIAYRNSWLGN